MPPIEPPRRVAGTPSIRPDGQNRQQQSYTQQRQTPDTRQKPATGEQHHPPPDPVDEIRLSQEARLPLNPSKPPLDEPPPVPQQPARPQGAESNRLLFAAQAIRAIRMLASPSADIDAYAGWLEVNLHDLPLVQMGADGFTADDVTEALGVIVLWRYSPLLITGRLVPPLMDVGEAQRCLLWSAFDPPTLDLSAQTFAGTCQMIAISEVDEADAEGIDIDAVASRVTAFAPGAELVLTSLSSKRGLDRLCAWVAGR